MEKYRCNRCGAVFDKSDAGYGQEYVGDFWGAPAYEKVDVCPECDSDDLDDFEIPYEECEDYPECDYDCDNCEFRQKVEAEK